MGCLEIGNRESHIMAIETTRGTLADFATSGFFPGVETVISDFNENQKSLKPRISVSGGMQRETMDEGVPLYQFNLKWKITDFRFMMFFIKDLTEAGSDPYTHTFDIESTDSYNFFSYQRILEGGTKAHTYLGCAITRLRFEFQKSSGDDESGYITVSASVVATDFNKTDSVQSVPDSTTKDIFTFNQFKATIGGSVRNEISGGSIELDCGVNPEDFLYANSANDDLIGELCPVFYKTVGNFNINVKDSTLIDEWEEVTGIAGTNTLEITRGTNDKIVFNLADMFNLQPFPPTEYKGISKANVVYDTTITNIVVTDSVEEY